MSLAITSKRSRYIILAQKQQKDRQIPLTFVKTSHVNQKRDTFQIERNQLRN